MDQKGHYGIYGGQYVAETLMPALTELDAAYRKCKDDPEFQREFNEYLADYIGRASPLYYARRLSEHCGGA
ncbi:MAG: tryptophan synthase subunit beta, partial [Victivallaceae bacterium]